MFDSTDTAHTESADRKAFGLGLLLGAVVGASAALLLAPASGEQTRRKIRRGATRLYDQSGALAVDLWDDANRSTRQLRKMASKELKRGVRRSNGYAQEAAELVEMGRRRLGWR